MEMLDNWPPRQTNWSYMHKPKQLRNHCSNLPGREENLQLRMAQKPNTQSSPARDAPNSKNPGRSIIRLQHQNNDTANWFN